MSMSLLLTGQQLEHELQHHAYTSVTSHFNVEEKGLWGRPHLGTVSKHAPLVYPRPPSSSRMFLFFAKIRCADALKEL